VTTVQSKNQFHDPHQKGGRQDRGAAERVSHQEDRQAPLEGAKFRVNKKTSWLIGEYNTDSQGHIVIDGLQPGWYTIQEVLVDGRFYFKVNKTRRCPWYNVQQFHSFFLLSFTPAGDLRA